MNVIVCIYLVHNCQIDLPDNMALTADLIFCEEFITA